MDTVETVYGKMIVYSNKTWSFLNKPVFDGVMNPRINRIMTLEQETPFSKQSWNNDVCFTTKNNDLSLLKDTVWLCLTEDSNKGFKIPVPGVTTSRYGIRNGKNHNGIDLNLKTGDTVCAAWSGKVRYAKFNDGGFGNLVIIRHHNGLETFYAHLSKLLVFPDQDVIAGETIGLGGSTGHSTGPHLHFEVRFYDDPINPEEMIDFANKKLKFENLFVHKSLFKSGAKPSEYFDDKEDEKIEPKKVEEVKKEKIEVKKEKVEVKKEKEKVEVKKEKEKEKEKEKKVEVRKDKVKYYMVKSGDTLSAIAARHKLTVSKLCQLNGIKSSATLRVGKSLRVN
jgi:LysM repeat protein